MINIKKLKQSLTSDDIVSIVTNLGGDVVKQNTQEIIFSSICHHIDASQHNKRLYYYTSSQVFKCYSCSDGGDIFWLVQRRWELLNKKFNFVDVLNYVCSIVGIDPKQVERKTPKDIDNWQERLDKYIRVKNGETILQIYDDKILNFFDDIYHQTWIDDNITITTMQKYEIKWYNLPQEIIIPVRNVCGDLVGIRSRALEPDASYKYRPTQMLDGTMYKFPSKALLYGEYQNQYNIQRHKKVVLAEAEKSVLQAEGMFPNDNFALALFGKSMSTQKRDWIITQGVDEVVLGLDFDYAEYGDEDYEQYEKEIYKLAKWFKGYCRVSVLVSYGGHKMKDSPFDNGKEFYINLWENREVIE